VPRLSLHPALEPALGPRPTFESPCVRTVSRKRHRLPGRFGEGRGHWGLETSPMFRRVVRTADANAMPVPAVRRHEVVDV